ncbi:MAG: transmembrane domain-containing protein [Candidatus Methanomethylophilaceae archaeon]
MNSKLLSALIIAVMITSVCAAPFAAAEEPDPEDTFALKAGDSYGLLIDIGKEDVYNLINEAVSPEVPIDIEGFIKGFIENKMKIGGDYEEVEDLALELDINAKAGLALSIVSVTDEVNTYRLTGTADADAMVRLNATVTFAKYIEVPPDIDHFSVKEYIEDNPNKIEENKKIDANVSADVNLGASVDATVSVNNATGAIESVDGTLGVYLSANYSLRDIYSRTVNEEKVFYTKDVSDGMTNNAYVDLLSFDADGVTMIQATGIVYGFGDDDENVFFSIEKLNSVETALNEKTVETVLSVLASVKEIDLTLVSFISGIIGDNESIIEKLPDEILTDGKIDPAKVEPYLPAINKVFEFIFGDDGIALSDSEVDVIRQSASDVLSKCMSEISDKEFTVEFYPDLKSIEDPSKAIKKTVRFGDSAEITDDVKAYMNAPEGKVFIGWFACIYDDDEDEWYTEFEGPDAVDMITCDMKLIPLFADKKTSIKEIYESMDDDIADEIFAIVDGNASFDAEKLAGKDNVHIEVGNDGDAVGSIVWNFKGNNAGAGGDVKLGYSATKEGSVVTIDFMHSGDLPAGTSVTIDMGSSFDAGTVLKVYHIYNDGSEVRKDLVSGTATVGADGKVTIPIAACSSYSFEVNDAFAPVIKSGGDGGSDGGINMLLVGGGIAAVAVIGIGAFLFMRRQ